MAEPKMRGIDYYRAAQLLAAADALAAWVHRGDKDKQGKPIIGHLRRVAKTLREGGWPAEVRAAGLLHDSWEDGRLELDIIARLFGLRVAELVKRVSRIDALGRRIPGRDYRFYIWRIARTGDLEAIAIKLADLCDNLDPERGSWGDDGERERLLSRYREAVEVLERASRAEAPTGEERGDG